jgi:hypothetical protein
MASERGSCRTAAAWFICLELQLPGRIFWLLDLATMHSRRLTRLNNPATMRTFDITPDGRRIVFDRLRENSDILLIDLATKQDRP